MLDIHCLLHSEPGGGHINEDVVVTRPHPGDADILLCALADGQGGQAGGAAAARVAVEESLRAASSFPASELREEAAWYAVVGAADEAVCKDDRAGYCSLVSLCVSGQGIWGASCGDIGALLLSGGCDTLLTDDQRKDRRWGRAPPVRWRSPPGSRRAGCFWSCRTAFGSTSAGGKSPGLPAGTRGRN